MRPLHASDCMTKYGKHVLIHKTVVSQIITGEPGAQTAEHGTYLQ